MKPELPREKILRQVNKIFENTSSKYLKVSSILSQLEFPQFKRKKYSKYPLEAVAKLYVYKKIKGLSNHYEKLVEDFTENPEEAIQLGFFRNVNNKVIFPPKRTYNHYLQDKISETQLKELDWLAENILILANNYQVLLDIEIVKKTLKEKKRSTERVFKETSN